MAPAPIPAPLPPWARWLIQLAPLISAGLQEVLDYIGEGDDVTGAAPLEWRRVALRWHQPSNPDPAETLITTIDIVNITNGSPDGSWTAGDYSTVDGQLANLPAAWAPHCQSRYTHFERAYYRMQFNPLSNPKPFAPTGAPDHVVAANIPGTTSAFQASQVALTHTELTPYRKHWGRSYWPACGGDMVDSTGHCRSADVSSWAGALNSVYAGLQAAEFFPVVVVTQVDKLPARGLLGVEAIQVDNVFDVIRRRRAHESTQIARVVDGQVLELGPYAEMRRAA